MGAPGNENGSVGGVDGSDYGGGGGGQKKYVGDTTTLTCNVGSF